MTQGKGERIYRACGRCRHRKVKCDLYSNSTGDYGKPPCVKCFTEGAHCALASSRRGGDHTRHRKRASTTAVHDNARQYTRFEPSSRSVDPSSPRRDLSSSCRDNAVENEPGIQNPLQALELLAKVAATEDEEPESLNQEVRDDEDWQKGHGANMNYDLTQESLLGTAFVGMDTHTLGVLIENYQNTYHGFLPVVPPHLLRSRQTVRSLRAEPFVMTAILLIATKERPVYAQMHDRMWDTMREMLLQVALGDQEVRTVGCVEGLLILAEWVPHVNAALGHVSVSQKGTGGLAGSEDTAAWTLVGLAVRQAYLLHLDKYAFRGDAVEDPKAPLHRKRLVWTYTYIADRQISIRMGQAFWCRGPSLATKFTASDFPTLQPHNAYEDDYASVLQSQLELTVFFGNIHDILYASRPQSVGLMLRGDYTKYLDDSMQGLAAWKQSWNNLSVSQHLKLMLEIQYEYLRLYVHGFAFQAAISRLPDVPSEHSDEPSTSRFRHGILATPDGRHIFLAISAAKSALELLGQYMNPTKHLRFLGPRYYLYAIHCAVFLFKAASYGAIGSNEERECATVIDRYVDNLRIAAPCERHIASRHAVLLTRLWHRSSSTGNLTEGVSYVQRDTDNNTQRTAPCLADALLDHEMPSRFAAVNHHGIRDEVAEPRGAVSEDCISRHSTTIPESSVTGLYGSANCDTVQQYCSSNTLDFLDFGAYSEPDLRYLISLS